MKKIIHIVFGDSAEGNLKFYLRKKLNDTAASIVSLSDDCSIGPVYNLDSNEGLKARINYFKDLFDKLNESEVVDIIENEFTEMYSKIKNIDKDSEIIIWHGDNAIEKTALAYVVSELKECNLKEVNVSNFMIEDYEGDKYNPSCLAECEPKCIGEIMTGIVEMSLERKEELVSIWEELKSSRANLRIFKDGKIESVEEDYYDSDLCKNAGSVFVPANQVIGDTMGRSDQLIGDVFLEYRLRKLIEDGKLECKGKMKKMSDYKVKYSK